MTDKPILFSAPMVRALLDGRKTQTRRVIPVPAADDTLYIGEHIAHREAKSWFFKAGRHEIKVRARYQEGNRLWVREACQIYGERVIYRADADPAIQRRAPWRSAIHMPRWASRLTLIVTDVRVQRLQQISEADACAEGCEDGHVVVDGISEEWSACTEFRHIWNSLHGPDAWDANPWVVALTFEVERCNIDLAIF